MLQKSFIIVGLTLFLLPNSGKLDWRKELIGPYSGSYYYEVKVGDGRNDGIQRVYCACWNGHVVEWTYNEDSWSMVDCGAAPPSSDNRMIGLWIGRGQNDGLNRLYGANADGHAYEFSYVDTTWEMEDLGSPGEFYAGITLGTPRNDGTIRVCAGGYHTPVREYSWNGASWDTANISLGNRYVWPLAIAQGRNDGIERIYCPDWYQYYLREYTWAGIGYDEVLIESPQNLVKAVVGPGRNDAVNRVYASGMYGHIHEFTYEYGVWESVDIHPYAPLRSRYGLCFGNVKNDDTLRLYSVAQNGDIREHTWEDGIGWDDSIIDAVSGATVDITVGKGRNDDTNRLYVSSLNGYIYEYTHIPPSAIGVISDQPVFENGMISVIPNPFLSDLTISYHLSEPGRVNVALYNVIGSEVFRLTGDVQSPGDYTIHYDIRDKTGAELPTGVYFCKIDAAGLLSTVKLLRLK